MHRVHALVVLPLMAFAVAQAPRAVPLPSATGNLTVPAEWQVLDRLPAAAAPASDAAVLDHGQRMLVELQQGLEGSELERTHLLLHRTTSTGGHRILLAYSTPVRIHPDDLIAADSIAKLQPEIAARLPRSAGEATPLASEATGRFAVAGLHTSFRIGQADPLWRAESWVVPAGERLQFFVGLWPQADDGAADDVTRLVQSFDGAKAPSNSVAGGAVLGGCAGAIAGILAARRRKRRQLAQAVAE